ncbi:TonB-dependent receptor [Litoribacter alkaliphilus]|uniref:TonB-dependent receptor n=1 Tax=Litoribacter ruber TaxID=702568 RepID=A0AAP2CKJ2_9BACT|nr:TonB-dependent receptor [Litoribacter alkaliphilus]MBS9525640.1 TonB-dependent receptor [Litoribacter alkaliphilus]
MKNNLPQKFKEDLKCSSKNILLIFIILAIPLFSFAQSRQVEGVITDESGEGIPGATILLKGTDIGTASDIDGNFTLDVPNSQSVLVFSSIGFRSVEVPVENKNRIDITLSAELSSLEEVIVVGYGTTKKDNLTGAINEIGEKAIEGKPVTNAYQALQGESPGLVIQQGTSEPGSMPQINIRGLSTMSGNTPLIVIDGVIGSLNNVNPNDIESVSVLKDAASAAIYGSRAANGVILVTTKAGKEGKPKFTYSGQVGIQQPTNFPKIADSWEYATMRNEALVNSRMAPAFSPEQILDFKENGPNVSHYEALFKDQAIQSNHNLSVSGSQDGLNYMMSVGYMDQESLFRGPDYGHQRYNFRINLDKQVNEKIKIGGRVSYARNNIKSHAWWTEWLIEPSVRMPPIYNIVDANGNYTLSSGSNGNPLAQLEQGGARNSQNDEALGNVSIEYEPIQNLLIKGVMGGNITSNLTQEFRRAIEYAYPGGGNNQNSVSNQYNRSIYLNPYLTASYSKNLSDKHDFDFMLGASSESFRTDFFGVAGLDVPGNEYGVIDNVSELQQSETYGSGHEWAIQSFFGRVNYRFQDKYLLEGNLRLDGSSRFSSENRWGIFPSVSAGWILSKEDFFAPIEEIVSFAKIRASWGQLGNQDIGDLYGHQSLVNIQSNVYAFGGVPVPGSYYSVSNPFRTWETSTMANLGLDLAFLDRKLSVGFDVFDNLTENILLQLPVPAAYGLGQPIQNAGVVRNRGWEVSVDYRISTGSVNHGINMNLSDSWNEVVDLRGREFINGTDVQTILREGFPMNSYFALRSDGYFNSHEEIANSATPIFATSVQPGDLKYVDRNNDGQIDYENDRFVLGNSFPRYTFGFTYSAAFKGFDFSIFIQGVGERHQWIRGEIVEAFHNNNEGPVFERHLDRWTPNNHDALYPRLTVGTESVNNAARSDFYIFDARYLRVKNVQLGYTIPTTLMSHVGLSQARIYLTGLNLLTFSPMDIGVDPESFGGAANNGRVYPVSRVFSMGLDVNF